MKKDNKAGNGEVYQGFEPYFDNNSRVLILGSFPSVKSREINFYYGHKQNRFWPLMSEIFGDFAVTTDDRKKLLTRNCIALWDIVTECTVSKSDDNTIKPLKIADLSIVCGAAPIERILCNGRVAYELTLKNIGNINIPAVLLSSTSPRYGKFTSDKWKAELAPYVKNAKK